MNTTVKNIMKSPWTYFLATFLWTWGLCAILVFGDLSDKPQLFMGLFVAAMIGPGVTGVLFTYLTKDPEQRRDFWRRAVDVRRLSPLWLAIVVLLPFVLQLLSGLLDGVGGGAGLRWGDSAADFVANPGAQLLTLCVISLVPFCEELGWRGYAQDRLQDRHSALVASLILGVVWSLWHLPAFFIPGSYHAELGFGSLECWLFFAGVVALSMVLSWIYINTRRSILVMVIFHAVVNLSGELIGLSETGETFFTLAWFAAATTIAVVWGRTMRVGRPARAVSLGLLCLAMVTVSVASALANPPELQARFQAEVETLGAQYELPGVTAAYILPDGSVGTAAAGLADIEAETPMSPESRMLAGSVGKTFVGAVAAVLAQDGVLDLDDPVASWLGDRPWFERLPNHDTITLRHLLLHTSGLPDHVDSEDFHRAWRLRRDGDDAPFEPEDLIAFVLDRPALFAVGEGWSYTDTGYLLAGLVIEAATGRSYYDTVTQRFLKPLQLTLTAPSDRCELPGLAAGYLSPDNALGLPVKTTVSPGVMAWNPRLEWTGGGLVSNPRDLVSWAKALFEGRAMSAPYLATLLQSTPVGTDPNTRYGLGVGIHEDGPLGPTWGHGGWIPGYCSSVRYYPRFGVAVAFQINTDRGIVGGSVPVVEDMERRLAEIVTAAVGLGDGSR